MHRYNRSGESLPKGDGCSGCHNVPIILSPEPPATTAMHCNANTGLQLASAYKTHSFVHFYKDQKSTRAHKSPDKCTKCSDTPCAYFQVCVTQLNTKGSSSVHCTGIQCVRVFMVCITGCVFTSCALPGLHRVVCITVCVSGED